MANLEDIKDQLQSTIDSTNKLINTYVELDKSYDDIMKNAKASEISGLKRPNLYPYIQMIKLQEESMKTIKFHVECQIEDNKRNKERKSWR